MKQIINKKASHNYEVVQTFEAGIILAGSEIKSIRLGNASLNEAYCTISKQGEVFLVNSHIAKFDKSSLFNHDEKRRRKLLLHRYEINKLQVKVSELGFALIPLKLYFKASLCKLKIALCRGLKKYDKREVLKAKDQVRDIMKAKKRYEH